MSQWLGSWDSQATGVYRPGIEMAEDSQRDALHNVMHNNDYVVARPRFRVLRAAVSIIFVIVITSLLFLTEQVTAIFG